MRGLAWSFFVIGRRGRLAFWGAVLCACLWCGDVEAAANPLRPQEYLPDQVIVAMRARPGSPSVRALAGRVGWRVSDELPVLRAGVLRLPEGEKPKEAAERLRRLPEVRYAEPNYRRFPLELSPPDDPAYDGVDYFLPLEPGQATWYQWSLYRIEALAGWSIWPGVYYTASTKPAEAIKVAVIDTGVDPFHADFMNAGGSSADAAFGGQIDFAESANLVSAYWGPYLDFRDEFGHGTHVAGIIAAAANNGPSYQIGGGGIAGVGYNSRIIALKVLDASGSGSVLDVARAIIYAADRGARVINLSLGSYFYSQTEQDAINYAWSKGALVVAAAGNDGRGDIPTYPGACNRVLAVAATGLRDTRASYSNWGEYVGIAAPGGDFDSAIGWYMDIWSTMPTYSVPLTRPPYYCFGYYDYLAGTSMATPHAAGLAALYADYRRAVSGNYPSPLEVYQAIQKGADNVASTPDGGWEPTLGYGRINVYATMAGLDNRQASVGCITGQVQYRNWIPADALVTAVPAGGGPAYSTFSRVDGNYRLPNLPAGLYTVTAAYFAKSATKVKILVTAGCDRPAVDFNVGVDPVVPPGAIAGRVRDAVSGAAVLAKLTAYSGKRIAGRATSDLQTGEYLITGLAPRAYSIRITASSYLNQSRDAIAVSAGETTWSDFALQAKRRR